LAILWYHEWIHHGERYRKIADEELWMRLAIATRYGRCTLDEAMSLSWRRLKKYLTAVERLVKDENKTVKTPR
jgi:hypothetical protein